MKPTRTVIFRLAAVFILLAVAGVMMIIDRGHTVYMDNRILETGGRTYEPLYSVLIHVDGEEAASLDEDERGMSICIGQKFGMELWVTPEEGAEELYYNVSLPLPYGIDGAIINIPAYLAGLPQETYMTEFVPIPEKEPEETEEVPSEGDMPSEEDFLGDI